MKTITISLSEEEYMAAKASPPPFPESEAGVAWETIYAQIFGGLPGRVEPGGVVV